MTKPNPETATKEELVVYIEYQAGIINGASNLQISLAETCNVLANDLQLINKGETNGLRILNSDEKYFERINLMVKNKSDWASLTIGKTEETKPVDVKSKKTNIQDFVLK